MDDDEISGLAVIVVIILIICLLCADGCSNIHYAKIGELRSYSFSDGTHVISYESSIDQIKSTSETKDVPNLDLIKVVINSAVSKNFDKVYVKVGCFDNLPRLYKSGDSPSINFYCSIYGDYDIAIKSFDRSLYDSVMVVKINGYDNKKLNDYDKDKIVPIISKRDSI